MAFRPFKRALGETSLEKKCRWMFGVSLALLMTASFWWYSRQTDKIVAERNEALGESLVESVLADIHVNWLSDGLPPKRMKDYEDILATTRSLKYGWGVISTGEGGHPPTDPAEWEWYREWTSVGEDQAARVKAGEELEEYRGPLHGRQKMMAGKPKYQHYQPIFAGRTCADCHNTYYNLDPALEEGALMAVIRVHFDEDETIDAQSKNRAIMIAAAFVTAFLSMIALYIIVRFVIVKPLKHLRDVSNAVRQGDVDQRAHIKTGDEFEELGAAFNRMVRQLLSQQDELRNVNTALDAKLDELAEANLRLFEMNRLKSDFLSTVSHELRTPLNSILGFSEVLSTTKALNEKQRRFAANIQKSGRMLLDMINDILSGED